MSELKAISNGEIYNMIEYEGYCETNDLYYLKSEVDAAIAELKSENERLKKCEIWMMQHFYCEEVIACESAKNRMLKRALWLARAERAKECKYKYETWERNEERKVYKDYDMIAIVGYKGRTWSKVERKCRAKAEEYK